MGHETYEILCDKLEPIKPADSTLTYEEIVEWKSKTIKPLDYRPLDH